MPTEKLQIYKCEVCGNIVQVLLSGAGEPVCCSQAMKLQIPQHDSSELGEKHAPLIEKRGDKTFVQVKSHPMIPEHYIQFIEVYKKDESEVRIKYFKPEDIPEMEIPEEDVNAVEFCSIHGLWGENEHD